MKYECIVEAKFISRPNRFIANVEVHGEEIKVHVKNTGRCKELLIPGRTVYLEKASNPDRKTPFDLVAVETPIGIVNIDSQAPNAVVKEWLMKQDYDLVVPEYKYGNSRIDFYMEKGKDKYLLEVKGCTLIKDGIGYFPDAPTERGVKHLRELTAAIDKGYKAMAAFVIQVEGVSEVRPNIETHPEFGVALNEAKEAGVEVLNLECNVKKDELTIKASKS
ncbi:sugar fermentation stimulation protein A [Pseudobutyrivibrio sp. NOR37]|uniref:Sugar fermentation stimulation protein homolog n=1 Tax=Pseudobutyrivibrio xylanivorans TaxID=185007 RepID=A0A6M0LHF1_PSEXY|nr:MULTISPECIES: DNA/RNA nuclease SfsA [Pseudobutyrivibrio]NEX02005.1 DNA/RNA nuclease SfsA [Pseudobutyrivibrio xylanivorans]SFR73488.1 sugar fermentation stimulation protein A [Pseudobutyrivibrio sp. NOR37]